MKIVVIGGTGQVGSKVVGRLQSLGHDAVAAAPSTGVDIISGRGLDNVLSGAQVVIDVTNKITNDGVEAKAFFEAAGRNIAAAESAAGVAHHVALSVLGSERLTQSGYIAGKLVQESGVRSGPTPWTLVRAAQFFELVPTWLTMGAVDGRAQIATARFQPIAAQDVAEILVKAALAAPRGQRIDVAGPEVFRIDLLAQIVSRTLGIGVEVEGDPDGAYFGAPLEDDTLLPGEGALIGPTRFETWLRARVASR
jgi:uncharacterized protein YbjT (DUF2867 family)